MDLGNHGEFDFGQVRMICKHVDSSLEAALHWRNKYASDVDILNLMGILLALVNADRVKIRIYEICTAFKRLNKLSIVVESIFFNRDLLVVELTKSMSD